MKSEGLFDDFLSGVVDLNATRLTQLEQSTGEAPGKRQRLAEDLINDEVFVLDEEIVADAPRRRKHKRRRREKNVTNVPDSEMETETDMEVTEVKDNVNTEMGLRPEKGCDRS